MRTHPDPTAFWDAASASTRFTHPLDVARFALQVDRSGDILDFGCGQGRLCAELAHHGYTNITGVDSSPEMIRIAAQLPAGRFLVNDGVALPFDDNSFDVVLLFAVLTCIPDGSHQKRLVANLRRVLRPGGLLLISDYPLQTDARNRERYERFEEETGQYGKFRLPDGLTLRHHSREWFDELLADFRVEHVADLDARTMNGNPAHINQFWARKLT
jgi:SAM-dependent methyltransferase